MLRRKGKKAKVRVDEQGALVEYDWDEETCSCLQCKWWGMLEECNHGD
jgi:hypothetical protein